MMSLTSANIMTEAATAMLAQAMQLPNAVLKLLQ
jgi:flagellin-like hook-associated protein FlgL